MMVAAFGIFPERCWFVERWRGRGPHRIGSRFLQDSVFVWVRRLLLVSQISMASSMIELTLATMVSFQLRGRLYDGNGAVPTCSSSPSRAISSARATPCFMRPTSSGQSARNHLVLQANPDGRKHAEGGESTTWSCDSGLPGHVNLG